jgi:hypothetical protein
LLVTLPVWIPSQIEEVDGGIPIHLENSFESVNDRFILCGDLFLNLRTKSIIQYFGEEEVDLVSVIGGLGTDLRIVGLGPFSFAYNSMLKSICIPSSVAILCRGCFHECENLLREIFEIGCNLSVIEH